MTKELADIMDAFDRAVQANKKSVLATVVHIEGSAYRAPGARMLITEDGMLTGAISGGCLEGDVLRKALSVMIGQLPLLVTYDTSDEEDDVIGVSLGCNGIIRILLEPLPTDGSENPVSLLRKATQYRQPAVLVTFFSDRTRNEFMGTCMAFAGGTIYSTEKPSPVQPGQLAADLDATLAARRSGFVRYASGDARDVSWVNAFIEYIPVVPALIVAGAGNDVLPVADLAALMGWKLMLIDGRPAYASEQRFPGCRVRVSKPEEALDNIGIDDKTAILLMSHNYHYDKAVLRKALECDAGYIGILGPRKKRERLFAELREEGVAITPQQESRIFGPTGLDIGAETSEEIALSIIAEIQAVLQGRTVRPLRENSGHIHDRQVKIMDSRHDYGVLVLAAGKSERMGRPKQDLVHDNDTLIRNAVRLAKTVRAGATVAVIGREADRGQLADLDIHCAFNPAPGRGLSSSITAGLRYLEEHFPAVKNVLIMLCDQPFLTADHLHKLVETHREGRKPVVASLYQERKGVPAVFGRAVFPALLKLEGDTGAKHLIESMKNEVETVDFPEGGLDVDTEQDYQQIQELKNVRAGQ